MPTSDHYNEKEPLTYRMRIMGSIVIAELLCLALVLFWPIADQESSKNLVYNTEEIINIQAPVRTKQASSPQPPPSPKVPIPVPNDEPIEEEEIEFTEELFSDSGDSLSVTTGEGGQGDDEIVGNPEVAPSVISIEEPTFENNSPNKIDIYVTFLVNKKGTVDEASVDKILKYDDDGNATIPIEEEEVVGILPKIIEAALNWKFRPAKVEGKPVRAYNTQIFTVNY